MTISLDEQRALEALDARLRIVLPEEYQESYESMQPVPMGAAGLAFAPDGRVAWDEIWETFCDLAMAGGPPHKGKLLEPGTQAAIDANPDRYAEVVAEICRGIEMVTGLPADPSPRAGWVRVECDTETMAGWLLRAIVMENVAVRAEGQRLELPAAPHFRLEKEIKNVITVIAKTCHYWMGHMPRSQQRAIGQLFATLAGESPLLVPGRQTPAELAASDASLASAITDRIRRETGMPVRESASPGWLGIECPSVSAAVWMMRALVASNVLARREDQLLFVPQNPAVDPHGLVVTTALVHVHRLALARGLVG